MMTTTVELTDTSPAGPGTRAAVEIRGVSKAFATMGGPPWARARRDRRVALEPIDLDIAARSVTGIVGVNGSGKSTLIRILATLMTPDTGTVRIFGHDVEREARAVRGHINRVSVDAAFFKMLSPWENLLYSARLYGVSADARSRVVEVLERLGLPADAIDKPVKQLSRGQQQKVAIARSFLSEPALLLMDEPTTGLDPRSKRDVQAFVEELRRQRDVTIVLCTHDLEEAAALCERVVVLHGGRRVADGSPADLCRLHTTSGGRVGTLEDVFLALTGRRADDDPQEGTP